MKRFLLLGFLGTGVSATFQPADRTELKAALDHSSCCVSQTEYNNDCYSDGTSDGSNGGTHISEWDTSNVQDFNNLFDGNFKYCFRNFNADISGWDVSSGTTFAGMFLSAQKFNTDISGWDVSSGTNFAEMFSYAYTFNQNLAQWEVNPEIELDMLNNMFKRTRSLTHELNLEQDWGLVGTPTDFYSDSCVTDTDCGVCDNKRNGYVPDRHKIVRCKTKKKPNYIGADCKNELCADDNPICCVPNCGDFKTQEECDNGSENYCKWQQGVCIYHESADICGEFECVTMGRVIGTDSLRGAAGSPFLDYHMPNGVRDESHVNIEDISCGANACVARKNDGTAAAWGAPNYGGNIRCDHDLCSPLPSDVELTNVADISCGGNACVARFNDDTAVAWGDTNSGGDIRCDHDFCSPLPSDVELTNVADISCGGYACVARFNDDTAVAWGDTNSGGDATGVDLTNVADISCGAGACVALKKDGTAEAWPKEHTFNSGVEQGGDASGVDLTNVAEISCGGYACAALKNDGTAVVWGESSYGGNIRCQSSQCTALPSDVELTNVADISCGESACVARFNDGTAAAWGRSDYGGDGYGVDFTNVAEIQCGVGSCSALKNDGSAETWGALKYGGGEVLRNVHKISCEGMNCVAIIIYSKFLAKQTATHLIKAYTALADNTCS